MGQAQGILETQFS